MDYLEAVASSSMLPPEPPGTIRYNKEEWNAQRPIIQQMYRFKGTKLTDIVTFLENDKGFKVNERQLKRKINDWKLDKKVKGPEMRFIASKLDQRQALGKRTRFRVRDLDVPTEKIDRWKKRSEYTNMTVFQDSENDSTPSTPSDISYSTVADMRSPSPYRPSNSFAFASNTIMSPKMSGIPGAFGPLSPRINPYNHQQQFQASQSISDIGNIIIPPESQFEGQSPAPFTPRPSPVPWGRTSSNQQESSSKSVPGQEYSYQQGKMRYLQREEIEFQKRAEELRFRHGPDHPATLDCLARLAEVFVDQSRYRSAEMIYRQVAKSWQSQAGENALRTLISFAELSNVLILQGKYSEVERLIRDTHSRAVKFISEGADLCYIKTIFADHLYHRGNIQESENLYRTVIRILGPLGEPDDPLLVDSMTSLATILRDRGALSESEKILLATSQALELSGSQRIKALNAKSLLGEVYLLGARVKESEEIFAEVLIEQDKLLGREHVDTIFTRYTLARLLGTLPEHEEDSERLFHECVSMESKVLGKNHPDTLNIQCSLAEFLGNMGRYFEAEKLLREIRTVSEGLYGPNHGTSLYCQALEGDFHYRQGRFDDALSLISEVLPRLTQNLGVEHVDTKFCRGLYQDILRAINERALASQVVQGETSQPPLLSPEPRQWIRF